MIALARIRNMLVTEPLMKVMAWDSEVVLTMLPNVVLALNAALAQAVFMPTPTLNQLLENK